MTWFWMNIPLAVLFFLAWTLIPLWMVFKHPDADPGLPGGDEHPSSRAATALAGSAPSGPLAPATPAYLPDKPREEVLAGHH